MRRQQFLVIAFLVLSLLMGLWLFANWYVYSMADFTCADVGGDQAKCVRDIQYPIAIKVLASAILWIFGAVSLRREWMKH